MNITQCLTVEKLCDPLANKFAAAISSGLRKEEKGQRYTKRGNSWRRSNLDLSNAIAVRQRRGPARCESDEPRPNGATNQWDDGPISASANAQRVYHTENRIVDAFPATRKGRHWSTSHPLTLNRPYYTCTVHRVRGTKIICPLSVCSFMLIEPETKADQAERARGTWRFDLFIYFSVSST